MLMQVTWSQAPSANLGDAVLGVPLRQKNPRNFLCAQVTLWQSQVALPHSLVLQQCALLSHNMKHLYKSRRWVLQVQQRLHAHCKPVQKL